MYNDYNVDMPILEVQDIRRTTLAVLSSFKGEYPPFEINVEHTVNEASRLTFKIPARSEAVQYLYNENLIVLDGETYIITKNTLDDSDKAVYSIEAEHEICALKNKQNGKFEIIAETVNGLISKILEGTEWRFGSTDVDVNTKRHLFSENESIFTNLSSVANVFNGRLVFETQNQLGQAVKTVSLFVNPVDRGRYIKKGRDMRSISISYDTTQMVTRLHVFGEVNKVTEQPVSMIEANPTKKPYVEDYSYYTNQGISLDEIKDNLRFVKDLTIDNTDLKTPQAVYEFAVEELKRLCVPKVDASVGVADISVISDYMQTKPMIGEKVRIFDFDINLELEADIIGISKNYENPLDTTITISNVIEKNSALKSLVETGKVVDKITDSSGNINGIYIAEATIGTAHIGTAIIKSAHIDNAQITEAHIGKGVISEAVIRDGKFGNAEISNLSANKIDAGTIDTSVVRINGTGSAIEISGNQLLVNDTRDLLNPVNRVILGEYNRTPTEDNPNEKEYGLVVRSADGNTVMIDGNGVHNAGITNGSIDDNKINPDANIDGSKLNIATTITAINNDTGSNMINSLKIEADGKNLNVKLTEYNDILTEHSKNIQTNTSNIQVNAEQIALKVNQQTYLEDKQQIDSNLTDINNKIDGLQIGGNNLFVGTKDFSTSKWDNVNLTSELLQGCKVAVVSGMYPSTPSTLMTKQQMKFKIGETYTVQVEAKGRAEGLKLGLTYANNKVNMEEKVVSKDKFTKHTWTFISESEDLTSFRFESSNSTANNYIEIARIKVELGAVATDWCPSYDDIYLSIEDAKQQINDIVADDKFTPNEKHTILIEVNSIKAEKPQIDMQTSLYPTISTEKNNYHNAYTRLITYIDPYLTALKINETDLIDPETYRTRFHQYYDSKSALLTALQRASKDSIDSAKAEGEKAFAEALKSQKELDDFQNINKVTPAEKNDLDVEWKKIKKEYVNNINLANSYKITTEKTAYINAYNRLNTIIPPLLTEALMNTTSDVDGVAFNLDVLTYYDKQSLLLKKVNEVAKDIGDNAVQVAQNSLQQAKDYADSQVTEVGNSLTALETTMNGSFKDGVIDEAETIAIKESMGKLDTEKADIDLSYQVLYGDINLSVLAKTSLKLTYDDYVLAHNDLLSYVDTAIVDGIATTEERNTIIAKTKVYNNALAMFRISQTASIDDIAFNKAKNEVAKIEIVLNGAMQNLHDMIMSLNADIYDAMLDGSLTTEEKNNIGIKLGQIYTALGEVNKEIDRLLLEQSLVGAIREKILLAKSDLNTAYTVLESSVVVITGKVYTLEDDIDIVVKNTASLTEKLTALATIVSEALDIVREGKINDVMDGLDDVVSDNKFTPNEKVLVDRDMVAIRQEYTGLMNMATSVGITTEKNSYKTAYDNLNTYINPLLANLLETSDIVANVFKSKFTDYTDKRSILSTKISEKTKEMSDLAQEIAQNAQKEAEKVMGEINNMGSDSKITPVEKLSLNDKMQEIIKEKASIVTQAGKVGVSVTDYNSKYTTLYNYCYSSSSGILSNMTTTSDIVRLTYQNNFNNYYVSRQTVLDNILQKTKENIAQAESNSNAYTDGHITTVNNKFGVVESEIQVLKDKIALTVSKDEFDETITNITNRQTYQLKIISTNGEVFNNGVINTMLQAIVYRGGEDVTAEFQDFQFKWTRVSSDSAGDTEWNNAHSNGFKSVQITHNDFRKRAVFNVVLLDQNGNRLNE